MVQLFFDHNLWPVVVYCLKRISAPINGATHEMMGQCRSDLVWRGKAWPSCFSMTSGTIILLLFFNVKYFKSMYSSLGTR